MAKPDLGSKRICGECGAKFYDLHRDPILCPKCGTEFELAKPVPRSEADKVGGSDDAKSEKAAKAPADVTAKEEEIDDSAAEFDDDVALDDDEAADDAFLEDDEDEDTDVSDIIGGTIGGDDED